MESRWTSPKQSDGIDGKCWKMMELMENREVLGLNIKVLPPQSSRKSEQ